VWLCIKAGLLSNGGLLPLVLGLGKGELRLDDPEVQFITCIAVPHFSTYHLQDCVVKRYDLRSCVERE
jgi:hypothetical protein